MPFPYDRYPWLNFQELNLAYFIKHFREIFDQWDQLNHDLINWKEETDQDLADWKSATETGLESWKTGLTASLETWKAQTASDISSWESATLAALDAWKTATTAVFEQIRVEAAGSASAAAASATAADTARAAAVSAQTAAEQAAADISAALTQIQTNSDDIADLKSALSSNEYTLTSDKWQSKSYSSSTGSPADSTTRISTIDYISELIASITPANGYEICIYAWDDDNVFQGCWDGLAWLTGTQVWFANKIVTSNLTGNYNLRVLLRKADNSTITTNECTNAIFASVIGDLKNAFEDEFDNVRKQTGVIPLSWVVGYAFPNNGQFYPTNRYGIHSDFFGVTPGETLFCTETGLAAIPSVLFYSAKDTASWISAENLNGKTEFTVPANANYAVFGLYRGSEVIPVSSADVVVWDGNTKYYDIQFKETGIVENALQATNGSYKIQCGVNSGASSAVIKIPLKIYAGGVVNFRIANESGFPSGISFTGYQVRNDANGVVITTKKRDWTVNAFNSEYITIGAYFNSALESNYTFDVEISFISEAVHDILSNIVGIGVHTDRYEGFGNFNIYGINRTGSILQDSSGDYNTPPIEISGGHVSGMTIKETGGVTEHSAYCIHTDNAANANNSLLIEDCYIESNSGHCMGVGTRIGYDLTIRNCVFKITNNTEGDSVCVYIHNSNNEETTSAETASHVTFVGCTFISDSDKCIKLQDWKGASTDYVEFAFIDCTFSPASGNVDDSVFIEYRSYTPEEFDSQEFKNKFSLSGNSVNNNVSWLNAIRS